MFQEKVIDEKTFIKYCLDNNIKNVDSYLKIIHFYQKTSIHNLYYLSFYVLSHMKNKNIINATNYFRSSLINNIKKLNNYNSSDIPLWFNKEYDAVVASSDEIKEIDDLLNLS